MTVYIAQSIKATRNLAAEALKARQMLELFAKVSDDLSKSLVTVHANDEPYLLAFHRLSSTLDKAKGLETKELKTSSAQIRAMIDTAKASRNFPFHVKMIQQRFDDYRSEFREEKSGSLAQWQ